ncbi:MAG: hypothetical protein HY340_01905 [Candidatus Kerfeldbacteria bacterium]|nr:hypothetical protein [Candidatus Kerfeldbacteria bacterium]
MVEVKLPFHTLYICETCGLVSHGQEQVLKCESVPAWESPDVQVGERVWVYDRTVEQNRFVRGVNPEPFWVRRLFYARPGEHLGFSIHHCTPPRPHQLCIELYRGERWDEKGAMDPHIIGFSGIVVFRGGMTYTEFLLWHEGDHEKLAAVGLIDYPKRRAFLGFAR